MLSPTNIVPRAMGYVYTTGGRQRQLLAVLTEAQARQRAEAGGNQVGRQRPADSRRRKGGVGGGGISKRGPGTLFLNAANTYQGATNISQGTLSISAAGGAVQLQGLQACEGGEIVRQRPAAHLHQGDMENTRKQCVD